MIEFITNNIGEIVGCTVVTLFAILAVIESVTWKD